MTFAELPASIANGAALRGNEYGWNISAFPGAVQAAQEFGYACLGGLFQFRLADGSTCEMYWVDADSKQKLDGESWQEYSRRSCLEVLDGFRHRIATTDFAKEAAQWPVSIDPERDLVFVACFVTESELKEISAKVVRN